jgi:hypothetical protein
LKSKRVLIISDLHCGSQVGLTPPEYQYKIVKKDTAKHNKFAKLQQESWNWFADSVAKLKKEQLIDLLIVNGDMIDGNGYFSGGTEHITTDREIQCEMAIEIIDFIGAKRKVLPYGTPVHAGKEEDWENIIAKNVAAKIGGHEWILVNGVMIDTKHKVNRSSIPLYGRHTAVAREKVWNSLWAEAKLVERADIIIRSHVHYFSYCGGANWLALTTPCLKTMGDKYGSRQCMGLIDFGMIKIDIYEDSTYDMKAILADLEYQKAKVIKI